MTERTPSDSPEPTARAEETTASSDQATEAFTGSVAATEESPEAGESKLSDVASVRTGGRKNVPAEQVLQRIVMPRSEDPLDVRPLYVDEPKTLASTATVVSRRSMKVPAHSKVSFASYFNAFPASYWKRWTQVEEVVLRLKVRGAGRLDVYRSKPNGDSVHLEGTPVSTPKSWKWLEFRIALTPFEDGGWIWFDMFTNDSALEIDEGAWTTDLKLASQKVVVGTTTMRPADCVVALRTLGEDSQVLDVVERVVVADQGSQKIRDTDGFDEAARRLGDKLHVIEQANLGGSGGFTRVMYEGVYNSDAAQVMLLDDDIALEPDGVLRANAFARAATQPVIVGGHMLNLQARSRLHTMGEVVDLGTATWRAAPGAVTDYDFSKYPLRQSTKLHKRIHSTYNGWWMCLFPREVIENTGLPLPLFIKHDDSEYSLRAAEHGYPTVSLPGAAVWHMPWTDKNDATDWTAYFHTRNRLIMAALHSPDEVRSNLVKQGLKLTLRHLLSMEYSTVAVQLKAVEDFMEGPQNLFESLRTALPEVRELRKHYSDAQTVSSAREFPTPTADPIMAEELLKPPVNPAVIAARASKALLHNLKDPSDEATERPQLNIPAASARWFLLGSLDSATVSTADGSGVAFRRRDPEEFRRLGLRALATYRKLAQEWPRLRESYRAALPELTSAESWKQVYDH
ncbi:galactofuranosylgalactofuranosylrhamnosyl-N-acetylglucosaminyl-diphospho-decaprenol beta-1,5/1,6-galactofuranosyltransferase [Saccharopolyspora lacisalsi]|uniref:Galactofuranosylgalactofuranosylrhamnosyl-N-acetylglucosaminyl-diphospho-decaprenol beta-1,5/1,6-galactofuranosyltransferase n=1 Tax=Halosaccharopolyspora lacisalsi TaxID=1000566 RepID=A0A839E8E9_9PSEU|nr:glycosyltransferase [Halosaccharopolyspora lacisalsi]MBA8827551.1 galactofuranosylgalactofuranosylrhamnosyl-N-acetylglucosaminyl-diphospho-decaprenol beta-1,5/1,6-galactofuranosyltransferase [Halosaccharopolyspora lacisalsi]